MVSRSKDALATILRSMRMETGLLSRAELTAPWGIATTGGPWAIFHAVVRGHAFVQLEVSGQTVELHEGDIAVITRGEPHTVKSALDVQPVPIGEIGVTGDKESDPLAVDMLRHGGEGPQTDIVCGRFALQHAAAPALGQLLPPLLFVSQPGALFSQWLESSVQMLSHEHRSALPGIETIIARITDVLFVHVLRAHIDALPEGAVSWLGALRDPQIAHALAMIHERPHARWTVASLAREAGMSRSGFFARFSTLVGEPPAQYLTRWRVHTAQDLLTQRALSTAALAERVGYASEDAFSKAFKRHVGMSPAAYRKARLAPA